MAPPRPSSFGQAGAKDPSTSLRVTFPQRAGWGFYSGFLSWGLSHRFIIIGAAVLVFFASLAAVPFVGQTFFAESDRPDFQMYLELPPGTSLHITDEKVRQIERGLMERPEVKHVFATVGTTSGPEYSSIFVKLDDKSSSPKIQQYARQQFSNLGKVFLSSETMSGASSSSVFSRPIQIELTTTGDFDDLAPLSQKIMDAIADVPGLDDIDRSLKPGKPEWGVDINRELAGDLRLNVAQVGSTLRTLINGERASQFRQGDEEVDIRVRLREQDRRDPREVLSLPLLNTKDVQLPLSSIATLTPASGPGQIDRRDRERILTVGANFRGRAQGDVIADIQKRLATVNIPAEVRYRFGGETEMMYETFSNLFFALGLSVVFVYMVLASLYGSFSQPLLIMLALPLSLVGALLSLLVTHKPLDMMAMIGVILLMGIVAKNSIIMVDFINMKRGEGLGVREAILTAAPMRLRPIMMTTLALIFGMLAIAIGFGSGGEFRAPMAITVIGGLTTSTFLSLVVVPVAYSFFAGKKKPQP
ncbi:MAG: efflux RND transporter permease subunit [Chloroflexi bacterium]|nr:efflux RND transporter permease subunit [Chloroflexota bacterium]